MRILYFGKICEEDLLKKKEKKQQPFFIAQYMFEKTLCDEFQSTDDLDIEIISIYQTDYFPKDTIFFKRRNPKNSKFQYLSFINLPYLRELTYFISACIYIILWFTKNIGQKEKYIYSSCHFPPVSLAIVLMGRMFSLKKIVTFTDLSLFTYSGEKVNRMKLYKRILMKPYVSLVNKLQESYDGYILFSSEMNHIVNNKNRPYLVIEGIYNSQNINTKESFNKKRAIAHAGTLNKEVGIETILEVFQKIEDPTIELWLMGSGDMKDEIIKRSKADNRIKYLGFMPRNQVFEKLKEAKLLVNLRNPSDIYTKYSFPSKMFEYMASGTPVFTTKLSGIPNEYYDYLYTVETYNNELIANKVIEIIGKSDKELHQLGRQAKEFILNEKNSSTQSKKVINFLKGIKN
ncbi:glycosyltransferase [Neobacillus mesonae]|uniref:glycosyltransferase n=1 Tax=Neobacillus mesonae TaxID=1193713 RepID=UPI00257322D8|nr:glycosyltransferase [Neobacillus mesonae]